MGGRLNLAHQLQEAYSAFARRDYAAAAQHARQVLAHSPGDPGALTLFGRLALVSHEPDVAHDIFRGLLDHPHAGAPTWLDLSQALQDLHRTRDAIDAARQALGRDSGNAAAHLRLGVLWLSLGERAEAARAFRSALGLEPQNAAAHHGLSQAEDLTPDSPEALRMAGLAGRLPAREAAELHYSLAQIHRRAADDRRFIEHLLQANALQRRTLADARRQYEESYDRLESAFTETAFSKATRGVAATPVPIFVLGMPRSGTTLVERILAAHPDVVAAGELDYMRGPLRRALEQRTGKPFPLGFEELPAKPWHRSPRVTCAASR